jgi:dCMP deaminase
VEKRMLFTEWAMNIAEATKVRSTCVSRHTGAVIIKDKQIIATGYNGSPTGCLHCSDLGYCERKKRGIPSGQGLEICRAGHAEANAVFQCAKHGISCNGATMYATNQPCTFCAISIIQAGIKEVVFKGPYPSGLAIELFEEAKVKLTNYEDALALEKIAESEKEKLRKKAIEKFEKEPRKY